MRKLSKTDLVELFHLGQAMSAMKWVTSYCDITAFRTGHALGEGVREELGSRSPDSFDRRIVVGGSQDESSQTTIVVGTSAQLITFVGGVYADLYRRGIIV